MGIYDQGLSNYQHGIDTAIQLGSQPQSLAASILGGFNQGQQQGFGNRMQAEHLGLQRDQLAEAQRRAAAQEAEARAWHQGQMQDRLLKQAQDNIYSTPEEAEASQQMLIQNGIDPKIASFLVKKPEETAESKSSRANWDARDLMNRVMVGMGGASAQADDRPAAQYNQTMGGRAAIKQRGLDLKEQNQENLYQHRINKDDLAERDLARKMGLDNARIDAINFKIERGQQLLPIEKDALEQLARLRERLPADNVSFGSGGKISGRSIAAFDTAVSKHMKEENDRRQAQNANIIRGKNIMTGQPAEPQPLLTREEAENAVTQGWERLSQKGTEGKGIDIEGGGPVLRKPGSSAPAPSGADFIKAKAKGVGASDKALKLKIQSSKPVARDATDRPVYKIDNKFYYEDGKEYVAPKG
jgi:hypothetical protein